VSENSTYQLLRSHLSTLRLATAAEALPGVLEQAKAERLGHTAMLERLLGLEVEATEQRRRMSLERFASLPAPWRLSDFDFSAQPSVDRSLVNELGTLGFLDDATNVLFIGPPGVGKTMLAIGLARASIDAGYRTYYTTAADLVARCHRAALEGRWATTMRFFAGPRLLIIDLCRCRHSSTNSVTSNSTPAAPNYSFRSSPSAKSGPLSRRRPTCPSPSGARSSRTPGWSRRSLIG
jgi:DNA replication protein DnaC